MGMGETKNYNSKVFNVRQSEGLPRRDIGSIRMRGWWLEVQVCDPMRPTCRIKERDMATVISFNNRSGRCT